jgi:hypothetical protein
MTNRLLLKWQLRLLFVMSLIPFTLQLAAQCECGTPTQVPDPLCPGGFKQSCTGDCFTLNYCGPDTIYIGGACAGVLSSPSSFLQVSTSCPSTFVSSFVEFVPPGGYPIGSMVPAGTNVTVHYIVTANTGLKDTLCFGLAFVDTIPPMITIDLESDTVGCEMDDYAGWLQAQMDSLEAHKAEFDNCGIDTIYNNGAGTFTDNCATQTVTFYVVDVSGNVDSTSASYTITDTTLPTLSGVHADTVIGCDEIIPMVATVTASDNCAVGLMATFSESSSKSADSTSCLHSD